MAMNLARPRERVRELFTRPGSPGSRETHLGEALSWIYRAQDAGRDRGVSHSYEIGRGWLPSYPETTGYIIPTLLNVWRAFGNREARRRALEMASWELGVQLGDGAIPELTTRGPAVFDTGQVLFGWVAAYQESGEERFLDAARRGGNWMLQTQDADGTWRRFTASSAGTTFYARAAWGLAHLGRVAGEERYLDGARRFLDWSLEQEAGRGWFGSNCLTDNDRPLLHTVAYTAEGQLEAGLILDDRRLVEAARRTARELAARVEESGRMAGRYDRNWEPAANWACLTGMAQISLVWIRLHEMEADPALAEAVRRVHTFLQSTHDLDSGNDGLRGGIRGSFPVHGAYCRYRLPNWATKFFLDAMLRAPGAGSRPVFKG